VTFPDGWEGLIDPQARGGNGRSFRRHVEAGAPTRVAGQGQAAAADGRLSSSSDAEREGTSAVRRGSPSRAQSKELRDFVENEPELVPPGEGPNTAPGARDSARPLPQVAAGIEALDLQAAVAGRAFAGAAGGFGIPCSTASDHKPWTG